MYTIITLFTHYIIYTCPPVGKVTKGAGEVLVPEEDVFIILRMTDIASFFSVFVSGASSD